MDWESPVGVMASVYTEAFRFFMGIFLVPSP